MKSTARSLLKRLHRLQANLYDFASALEDRAEKETNPDKKAKALQIAELVTQAGFELDVSQVNMGEVIEELPSIIRRRRSFNEIYEEAASKEIHDAYLKGEEV